MTSPRVISWRPSMMLGLAAEDLAQDLLDGLRRIPAHRGPRARLRGGPTWAPVIGSTRVDGADVPAVEVDRVVEEEVDLFQLFLLDVDDGVGELAELARVVPVRVPERRSVDACSGSSPMAVSWSRMPFQQHEVFQSKMYASCFQPLSYSVSLPSGSSMMPTLTGRSTVVLRPALSG